MSGYYYGLEAEQFAFFRIPKRLITDPLFKKLSSDAKLLYGLMLDRMSLSVKNNWLDEQERVFIYFTLQDICEQLCCKNDKAMKLLSELDSTKGIGLIERIKQGQGKPAKIYVKRFIPMEENMEEPLDIGKNEVKTTEKPKSRVRKNRSLDYGKTDANNTDKNNTEINNTDLSIHQSEMDEIDGCREKVKEDLSYELLQERNPYCDEIDEMVEIVTEALCTQEEFMRIGQRKVYAALVKERLQQLNYIHIEYILECLQGTATKIRNIKAYLLEALFNAPVTMSSYYGAKVRHDLMGCG